MYTLKRIFIIMALTLSLLYVLEISEAVGLKSFKPHLEINHKANENILQWQRLPYFAYYEVEALSIPPDNDAEQATDTELIASYRTWKNQMPIDENFPFRTYWRVSAQTLFHQPLGKYSDHVNLTQTIDGIAADFNNVKPEPTSFYPASTPASIRPMLTWTVVPGAVYYELEFLTEPPENPNDVFSSDKQVLLTREVFTNGYNADLSWYEGSRIFWRVRALNNHGNPLGVFSNATELYLNHDIIPVTRPLINEHKPTNLPAPLYPAYSLIPVLGALSHEIELTRQPPENPGGIEPSQYRIWSQTVIGLNDCYDDQPRIIPGKYYWRVRGIDAAGNPVGGYSDAAEFSVDLSRGHYAATFGDSITHGGGAISYSPADFDYSYQTYLNFPAVNLGKSGDTTAAMLARFDQDVLPFKPKYLLILGGTNSLRGGVPAAQVITELTGIRDKCLTNGIRPIFLTLPPINPDAIADVFHEETVNNWREEFDAVNQFIRQQRYFIDLEPHFLDSNRELPDYLAIDGLHPDIEGKKLIAQIINAHWSRVVR
ncbi:GDSL-type esterase/lipase family protein [Sporomusa sp. KB1]|uniref:SGNH/GDSL hydrolase family protein n=1 Tax=Sporomusa sp. KB1 TaxID=943346 RepID=UPI0011ABC271|nr:GDSL-type esterase/lipase family protein [Sporomusa sp. KB1]TWH49473.1 lysophospholipase L1-like esterase [Sporomusa sp. KB1]